MKTGAEVRLYNENVSVGARAQHVHDEEEEEVEFILSWFKRKNARILDLGCGTGRHALSLVKRGHKVTGLDKSAQAIKLAQESAQGEEATAAATFKITDIERDKLIDYGIHNLVISLGNTLSYLTRHNVLPLFDRVRRTLAPGGIFLFNTLYWASPFQRNIVERDRNGEISIIWERELKEDRGTILLRGHYIKENLTQTLEVQCYKVAEILNLLDHAGFDGTRWSNRLDFKGRNLTGANTIYCRALNRR